MSWLAGSPLTGCCSGGMSWHGMLASSPEAVTGTGLWSPLTGCWLLTGLVCGRDTGHIICSLASALTLQLLLSLNWPSLPSPGDFPTVSHIISRIQGTWCCGRRSGSMTSEGADPIQSDWQSESCVAFQIAWELTTRNMFKLSGPRSILPLECHAQVIYLFFYLVLGNLTRLSLAAFNRLNCSSPTEKSSWSSLNASDWLNCPSSDWLRLLSFLSSC